MSDFPSLTPADVSLTPADVRAWTLDRYYERGERYFRRGAIDHPRREGSTLKAVCQGSRPDPYRVEATFDADGLASAWCSCPIGGDGRCKHVVALLLTWIDAPEVFTETESLVARLKRRSTDQLIALIRRMIDRHPDLESLVDLSLVETDDLDVAAIERHVEHAFGDGGGFDRYDYSYYGDSYDYGYGWHIAEQLDPLLEIGREHAREGRRASAARIFQAVAAGVCERYEPAYDEEGEVASVVATCAEALGDLLADTEDEALRDTILRGLVDIFRWDVDQGGYGMSNPVPDALTTYTTPDECHRVADWLRDALPMERAEERRAQNPVTGESLVWNVSTWKQRAYGALILALEADRLDDETYLDLCRQTGQRTELVERLLDLGRVEDAAEAARETSDYDLPPLADLFVAYDAGEEGRTLVEERLDVPNPSIWLVRWFYAHTLQQEDYDAALDAAHHLFRAHPSPETYENMRQAAAPLGRWDDVRTRTLDRLRDHHQYELLTRLYLHEGAVGAALDLVQPFDDDRPWSLSQGLLLNVARAAEADYPDAAVALYTKVARRQIAARGRRNYADAAQSLRRVQAILESEGRMDDWDALIEELYDDELHRLPACRDEFQKAGIRLDR